MTVSTVDTGLVKAEQVKDIRQLPQFDNHEFVMVLSDKASGLRAYVAIHNTNLGPALGGTRMQPYASENEALRDVLNLSKAMSYKCALANLPYGGGKAVIIEDGTANREAVLTAYAKLVDKLNGLFKTGTDVGISDSDVALMGQYTSDMLGLTEADRGDMTTGKTAALGVFYAMRAALTKLYSQPDFGGRTVAIKGVGKLGSELARLVVEAGGSVSVSDINPAACEQLKAQLPSVTVADNAAIHTLPVDIYAPCALGNEFTTDNIAELQCRAVIGGANNQLATEDVGDQLVARGILYAPDFIANAGGLIYVADELEPGGFNKERVVERTKAIEQTMLTIFETAERENKPPHRVADDIALSRIERGLGAQ